VLITSSREVSSWRLNFSATDSGRGAVTPYRNCSLR
jgi:hypothetical protein